MDCLGITVILKSVNAYVMNVAGQKKRLMCFIKSINNLLLVGKYSLKLFPRYTTTAEMLSHRYNMLVENKLHPDELDEEHTGDEQQIRMFLQLDKKRPRVLTFGPDLEQMYHKYYWDFNLQDIDNQTLHIIL